MEEVLTHNQTFASPSEALAHYGKKGMKWGVITEDPPSSGSRRKSAPGAKPVESSIDDLGKVMDAFYATKTSEQLKNEGVKKLNEQASTEFPSKREIKANTAKAQADKVGEQVDRLQKERDAIGTGFVNNMRKNSLDAQIRDTKAVQDSLEKRSQQLRDGKMTDRQKKALIAAGAAAAAGGLYLAYSKKYSGANDGTLAHNQAETNRQWNEIFGEDHPAQPGNKLNNNSGAFYVGLTNKKALSRPEFVIPAGTKFQRLSDHEEDSSEYGKFKGAYATFLNNDKKMYGSSGEFGGKKFKIEFEAEGDVRVPTLPTVLAHLKQVHKAYYPANPEKWTDAAVYSSYHQMAGGSWSGGVSNQLFNSLRQFGYSAIVDDMDAGFLGDLPVVFFGKAKPAEATARTAADLKKDMTGLVKLSRRYA